MRLTDIHIVNFRSLRDVKIRLSPLACVVGHNNAGKSSLLIALSLLKSGTKLSPSDYYDSNEAVVIKGTFKGITEKHLERISPEHRARILDIVADGTLTLIRRYPVKGSSSLLYTRLVPKEERFRGEEVSKYLKGKRGSELAEAIRINYPELLDKLEDLKTQASIKDAIEALVKALPPEACYEAESPLPTGIPNSVMELIPEAIYIPAVKEIADEIKTKEAASFGKLLRVLLELVAQKREVQDFERRLKALHHMFSVQRTEDGTLNDSRLQEVQYMERLVEGFLKEQFRSIALDIEIPPPDLKAILGNARVMVN